MKILIIQQRRGIGDCIIFLPYIHAISKKFNSKVSLLIKENSRAVDLLAEDEHIGEIITLSDEKDGLMAEKYDSTELAIEADEKIRTFQADAAKEAGIFHHLITLPTYHTAALSTDNLAKAYFGDDGMLGYVKNVQRQEIRQGIACVKHQNMAGSDMGDDHKEYFAGEAALKAAGKDNTMNQF